MAEARRGCAMVFFGGLAFLLLDMMTAAALIALLCCKDSGLPKSIEWLFPLKGRWLWYGLTTVTVVLHLSMGALLFFLTARLGR